VKVNELISLLQKMPPEAEVWLLGFEYYEGERVLLPMDDESVALEDEHVEIIV
jgi:hypothetical protein